MILSVSAALLTAVLLYFAMFEDRSEFADCLKSCLRPEIISALRGRYWEDAWAATKILLWADISALTGLSVYVNFG